MNHTSVKAAPKQIAKRHKGKVIYCSLSRHHIKSYTL